MKTMDRSIEKERSGKVDYMKMEFYVIYKQPNMLNCYKFSIAATVTKHAIANIYAFILVYQNTHTQCVLHI